jgi:hypothetical protein
MSSKMVDHLFARELDARAARLAEDDFVEFFYAGLPAVGHFCCVACGRSVTSVGLLPPCPACGTRLWENAVTSPFATSDPSPQEAAYEQWVEEDLESAARALSAIWLGVPLGLMLWALLATMLAIAWAMIH